MRIADLGPVRALVGKVAKFMAPESLDLAEVPRLLLAIIGVCLAIVQVVIIILREDNGAGGRM